MSKSLLLQEEKCGTISTESMSRINNFTLVPQQPV